MSTDFTPIPSGTICFAIKDGKVERATVAGATDAENEAFTNRVVHKNNQDVVEKMAAVTAEGTAPNAELRGGRLVTLKPWLRSCYGAVPGNELGKGMYNTLFKEMKSFFSGESSLEDLKTSFTDKVAQMKEYLYNQGFGTGSPEETEQLISDTYKLFRQQALTAAVWSCAQEGYEKYGISDPTRANFKYYNADYYYQTEELKTFFADLSQELGQEYGFPSVDLSYDKPPYFLQDNFNTAWGISPPARVLDTDAVPPKGFTFACRDDGVDSYLEVSSGGKTVRTPAWFVGAGRQNHYNSVSEIIDPKRFGDDPQLARFLDGLYFYDTHGLMNLSDRNEQIPATSFTSWA